MTINDKEIDPEQYKLYSDGVILLKFNPPEGYMDVEYTHRVGLTQCLRISNLQHVC